MFHHCVASCFISLLPAAPCAGCFLSCFSSKVADDHQTTEMVIYHYNELPVNRFNCRYVISEAYNKVNTICRLSSVVVVGSLTNDDDRFIYIMYVWCCVD